MIWLVFGGYNLWLSGLQDDLAPQIWFTDQICNQRSAVFWQILKATAKS